ncbi:hypothetical protein J6590_076036 [Homalodisca vitripennis]|nr:hypothetical protein J6590_076036 [Homalodisca vitripennis]
MQRVTRVVHYHHPPPARYVYSRHVHVHEPATRLVRYYSNPLYLDHYDHHHHPVEELVEAPLPYYHWHRK